jgi:hypothetical protein
LSSIGGISPSSFLFLRGRTRARGCAVRDIGADIGACPIAREQDP